MQLTQALTPPPSSLELWTLEPADDPASLANVYCRMIWALAELFPALDPATVQALCEAARLIARAVVRTDKALDDDLPVERRAYEVLAAQVCQLEGVALLATLIPPSAPFWGHFRSLTAEFARASLREQELRAGSGAHVGLDDIGAIELAVGRNAIARAGAAALCELAGRPELVAPLDEALRDLTIAVQSLDDAVDWRDDLARRAPSLLAVRVPAELRGGDAATIYRLLLVEGHLADVLARGEEHLRRAREAAHCQGSRRWAAELGRLQERYAAVMALFASTRAGRP